MNLLLTTPAALPRLARCALALALALALAPAARAAVDAAAWKHRQTVTVPAAGPIRFDLPPELLDAARIDAADVRLLGPDGGETAFAVLPPRPPPASTKTIAVAPILRGRTTVIECELDEPCAIRGVRLATPAPAFVKGATLETRTAGGPWRVGARDAVIFRLPSGGEHLSIAADDASVAAVRITIDDDRDAPVPFTHVALEIPTAPAAPGGVVPVGITAVDSSAGETRIALDFGLRHRYLARLALAVRDPVFARPVRLVALTVEADEVRERVLASGTLRRLALPGGRSFADLEFPVETILPGARLELAVDDGDSPPLAIESVQATGRAIGIAFHAPAAGTYTLLAGNDQAAAPRYDVAAFASDWERLPSTQAACGVLERNPSYRPATPPPEVPETAGIFSSDGWRHRRTVTIANPGAQVLELDPEVLARAQPGLGDLRLVRGDRQVPYLVERSSRMRTLGLQLASAPDAARPSVGRWTIDLPVAGVPLARIVVAATEPIFDRHLVVSEIREDARGQPWPRILGEGQWIRRGSAESGTFAVTLRQPQATNRLVLEMDHGDNRPFAPAKVDGAYPLRRLRFACSSPGELVLHYGHASAGAPRYDLHLAAPMLLAAQEQTAELAPIASVEDERRGAFSLGGGLGRIAFWAALALVVVVLLWTVARLLPKP
jgi:hypothetical protein